MEILLELKILSDMKYVRLIKNITNNILKKKGFRSREKYMLNLAISEAIANIIEHSYNYKKDKIIKYKIVNMKKAIKFILIDYGKKVKREEIKSRELDEYKEGGLGIFLIENAMDKIKYVHLKNGTKLELTKKLGESKR